MLRTCVRRYSRNGRACRVFSLVSFLVVLTTDPRVDIALPPPLPPGARKPILLRVASTLMYDSSDDLRSDNTRHCGNSPRFDARMIANAHSYSSDDCFACGSTFSKRSGDSRSTPHDGSPLDMDRDRGHSRLPLLHISVIRRRLLLILLVRSSTSADRRKKRETSREDGTTS